MRQELEERGGAAESEVGSPWRRRRWLVRTWVRLVICCSIFELERERERVKMSRMKTKCSDNWNWDLGTEREGKTK